MTGFDVTSLHHRRPVDRVNRVSIGDLLERVTWSFPDKEAIVTWPGAFADPAHERLTYRQADALANRVANALLGRGLRQGDTVLMFCENSVEAYILKFGVAKAGLTVAPLNPMLAPDVVAHLIERLEPALCVVDAELWPRCEVAFAQAGTRPDVTIEIGGGAVAGSASFGTFVAGAATTEPDVEIHGDDIWEIVFTSGTTAMPKGAMISHTYSHFAAFTFALTYGRGNRIESDMKLLSFLPVVFHICDTIMSFPAFVVGGTLVLGRRFDAAGIAAAVEREGVTALWGGSPAMLAELADAIEAGGHDVRSLTSVVYGWTSAAPALIDRLKALAGPDLVTCEALGQTEAISAHRFWPDKWPEVFRATAPELNYVGVPNPLLAADLWDEEGGSLRGRPGVPGEIVYRSPVVTAGYYKDEEATAEAFRGGWFHSGDVCVYDEDDLKIMVDRSKDIVKSGGENVSSIRVEAVLLQHPAVRRAAVVGLPHEHWGEAVTAFVIPAEGQDVDADGLIGFCRSRLAGFETPKAIIAVDSLPTTVGDKVRKYELRTRHRGHYTG
ncbi:AMP-binding protein [Baekduia soli]|uniref:AMP-binding protein n=1 Tax=Baekduia soli TaxID=496014 RepID=A0A5B8U0B8_9ACTN|nr:AMP-binding protein [Baekduia soli]QEC46443.1 AMP-binding protein [Baekduia soli]